MKKKKVKPIKALKSGWSSWQLPIMKGYIMGCCDCGLQHEMEFEVMQEVGKPNSRGWRKLKSIKNGRVRMRAKRIDFNNPERKKR